jgi:hypothetical protein
LNAIDLIVVTSLLAETNEGGAGWWESAIVAAIVAAAVSLMTFGLTGRRARVDRQRQVFADAFEAVMEYREYPFIVRRRDPGEPAKERQRISGDLSKVQARLNGYKARLLVEDLRVGNVYTNLVNETRRIAGAMIKDGWNDPPVADDAGIHAPKLDFSELRVPDNAYLQAVADHLSWFPWVRRKWRLRKSS